MALTPGVISITVEYAKDLKDKDMFGKQDPYVVLKVGGQLFRTKTHKDGGKNPVWNETFQINILNENTADLTVYDSDVGTDDVIGFTVVQLAKAREQGSDYQQCPVRTKSGKQKGFVAVRLSFAKNPAPSQAGHMPVGYPPAGYPPAPSAPAYPPQGGYPPPAGYPPQGGYPPPHGPPAGYPPPQAHPPPQAPPPAPHGYPPPQAPAPGYPPPGHPPAGYPPPAAPGGYPPPYGYPPAGGYPPPAGYPAPYGAAAPPPPYGGAPGYGMSVHVSGVPPMHAGAHYGKHKKHKKYKYKKRKGFFKW